MNRQQQPIKKRTRIQGTVEETRAQLKQLQCDGSHNHGKLVIDFSNPNENAFESRDTAAYPPGLVQPWALGVQHFHVRLLGEAAALSGAASAPRYSLAATFASVIDGVQEPLPSAGSVRLQR